MYRERRQECVKADTMPRDTYQLLRERTVSQQEDAVQGLPIINLARFGQYFAALRVREEYKPADRLVDDLRERCGVVVSRRTLYAIERGEQLPRLDLLLALLVVLNEDFDYFYPTFREDIVNKLTRRGSDAA